MALVVDASVGLKWVLPESDRHLAWALTRGDDALLLPDFWLSEASNVLWLQVRKKTLTAPEAREGLRSLRELIPPIPTATLALWDTALETGIAVDHPVYDTLYVAFAIAVGAERVVTADMPFVRAMRTHPDPVLRGLLLPLHEWAAGAGVC